MLVTKSKYVEYCKCERKLFFNEFDKLEPNHVKSSDEGIKVGELARNYFGDGKAILIETGCKNPPINPGIYAEYPLRYLINDTDELYCLSDLFVINENGTVDIIEVKSSSEDETKEEDSKTDVLKKYGNDVNFQAYVACKQGFGINKIYIMTINKSYVFDGNDLDLKKLFSLIDVTDETIKSYQEVGQKVDEILKMNKESAYDCLYSTMCNDLGGCQYMSRCKKIWNLPDENSIIDVASVKQFPKWYNSGLKSLYDLYSSEYWEDLSEFDKRFINFTLLKIDKPYVNETLLKKELKKYKFPLYFFDFETVSEPIPVYANSRPYQQIPFQYSLHIMNDENDDIETIKNNHREFLKKDMLDPREELIKQMIDDLGTTGNIVAYNASFEKNIIKNLINDFPKYEKKLQKLYDRFIDLADIFNYKLPKVSGNIYKRKRERDANGNFVYEEHVENLFTSLVYYKAMGNSYSIKHVLPAMFPNDPNFDYTMLKQVHKGDEAAEAFKRIRQMADLDPDKEILFENMLKYCCLDTFAMVAIYLKLKKFVKE